MVRQFKLIYVDEKDHSKQLKAKRESLYSLCL